MLMQLQYVVVARQEALGGVITKKRSLPELTTITSFCNLAKLRNNPQHRTLKRAVSKMHPAYFKKCVSVVVVLAVLSMWTLAQSALATAPPKKIVVQTNRTGNAEIYSMDMDGSNPSNLTQNARFDGHPDWSAAANKIAFISDRAGGNSLYVMDPGGLNVHQVGTRDAGFPAWSPDGTKIAYASYGRLRVLDINSGGTASNDHQVGYDATVSHPTWSPDGTKIAYANYVGSGESDIEYISSTGTSTTASTTLTISTYPDHWYDQAPSWGHDGTIAYVSNRYGSTNNIFTVTLSQVGTIVTFDTTGTDNSIPSWAAGGGVIYYSHKPSGTSTYSVQMITQDGQTRQSINTGESDIVTIQQAPLPVVPPSGAHYVALGDSVAAGEGINYRWAWDNVNSEWVIGTANPTWRTDPYTSGGQGCHQSDEAYPLLVKTHLGITSSTDFGDYTCTGAATYNGILATQTSPATSASQLGSAGVNANSDYDTIAPDLVTLTLGADDVGFQSYMESCYGLDLPGPGCHTSGADSSIAIGLANQKTFLDDVLSEIQERGITDGHVPRVVLTTYYDPFPPSHNSSCRDLNILSYFGFGYDLTPTEMDWLRNKLKDLNRNIIEVAASYANVVVVPTNDAIRNNVFCLSDPWVYGPSLRRGPGTPPSSNGNPAPFHPTVDGQSAISNLVEAAIG